MYINKLARHLLNCVETFSQNGFARSKGCTKLYLIGFVPLACCLCHSVHRNIQNQPNSYPLHISTLTSLPYISYSNNLYQRGGSKQNPWPCYMLLRNSDTLWPMLSDFQVCVTLMIWDICSEWDTWTQTQTLRAPKRKRGCDSSRCGRTLRKQGIYHSHSKLSQFNVFFFAQFIFYTTNICYFFRQGK